MEEVSIIIPVYNAAKYLEQCLDSILNQEFTNFKLILINDGSKDESENICREYEKKDERIIVYSQNNQGAGQARNKGLEMAEGKYIMFIDPDDWVEKNLLKENYNLAEITQADWIIWSLKAMIYNTHDQLIKIQNVQADDLSCRTQEECKNQLLTIMKWNDLLLGVPWNKFYRRSIIDEFHLRFPSLRRRQDIIFNLEYIKHVKSLITTSKIYSDYRVIDKGYEYKASQDYYDIAFYVHLQYKQLLECWGRNTEKEREYINLYFLMDVLNIMRHCMNPKWKWGFIEKYNYIKKIMEKTEVIAAAAKINETDKMGGMSGRVKWMKINCIRKQKVVLLVCIYYIEHVYRYMRYKGRIQKKVGE